jgi:capsule polysaccharide export protein KpsE/RkpR
MGGTRASGRRYLGIRRTNGRGAKLRESEVARSVPRDFGVRDLVSNSPSGEERRKKVNVDFPRVSGIREVDVRRPDSREARSRIALLGIRQGEQCERK